MHGDLGAVHDEWIDLHARREAVRERIVEAAVDGAATVAGLDPEHVCATCLAVRELVTIDARLAELSPEVLPARG